MKKKKMNVLVTHKYQIEYEHDEHLKVMKDDLKKGNYNEVFGAGIASDGKIYGYSFKRLKGVKIEDV